MKVTKDEAIQMLIELADYVDHAVIYLDKEEIRTRLIIDIDKERDALMKIGFKPMPLKGVLMYF